MRVTFLILIAIYGIIECAFGIWMLVDLTAVTNLFGAEFSPGAGVFGVPLTVAVFAFTVLSAIAFYWVYKNKPEGATIGLVISGWLIFAAVLAYIKLDMIDSLIVDGVRGIALLIVSVLLLKKYSATH